MRRESSSDPGAASHSSIALLQERFRKLQRAKEMRAEREQSRWVFASPMTEHRSSGGSHHPGEQQEGPRWFLHPELVRPSRPLSATKTHRVELGPAGDWFPAFGAVVCSTGLWPERPVGPSTRISDAVDVDTSLHL